MISDNFSAEQIYQLIRHRTAEHPILASEICSILATNERTIRSAVSELRRKKVPVCASNGYWIAKNSDEFKEWYAYYRSKTMDMLRTLRFAKWTLADMRNAEKGQGELLQCK